jgi:hypothetical protein
MVAFKLFDRTPGPPTTISTSSFGAVWRVCVGVRDVWVVELNALPIIGFELTGVNVSAMKATLILCMLPKNCSISSGPNTSMLSYAGKKSMP